MASKQAWTHHPIREELRSPPAEFGLVRGALWLIGSGYLLYFLAFQFSVNTASNALTGKWISLAALAGFWGAALWMKGYRQRRIRLISWIADTTPAEPMSLRIEEKFRRLKLSLVDSAGIDVGHLSLNSFESTELPAHRPTSLAVQVHRSADAGKTAVVVIGSGRLLSATLGPPPLELPSSARWDRHIGSILLLIAAGVFFAMAVANGQVFLNYKTTFDLGEAARQWPIAKGKITLSKIETSSYVRGASKYSRGVTVEVYRPNVHYSYQPAAGPQRRHGQDILWGLVWSSTREEAERLLARYPLHAEIEVRYDPNAPETVVIEPGTDPSIDEEMTHARFWLITNGSIGILLAAFSIVRILRRRKQATG